MQGHVSAPFGILENLSSIESFLENVTGQSNPRLYWTSPYPWPVSPGYKKKVRRQFGPSSMGTALDWIVKRNERGRDVFFSARHYIPAPKGYRKPNGKTSKWMPLPPRSFFIDVDCGTDEVKAKNARLKECWEIAEALGIRPSYIVLSRNGFHFYWVIEEGLKDHPSWNAEENWREGQERLISIFRSDEKVKGPTQNMRLPGSLHWKGGREGFPVHFHRTDEPFPKLKQFTRAIGVYCLEDLFEVMAGGNPLGEPKAILPVSALPVPEPTRPRSAPTECSDSPVEESKSKKAAVTDRPRSPTHQVVKRALEEARQKPSLLQNYLGIDSEDHCPFHNDKNRSATIFKARNGRWLFKCHSSNCEVGARDEKGAMDFIEMIKYRESLTGVRLYRRVFELAGNIEGLNAIRQLHGKAGVVEDRLAYLERNLALLANQEDSLFSYNYAVKGWMRSFFEALFSWARKKVRNHDLTFPLSYKQLAGKRSVRGMTVKMYLMLLIGLVQRAQIPVGCRASQEDFKKRENVLNDTSWYRIPEWTQESLVEAIKALAEANERGFDTNNCSKAMVRKYYGEEMVHKVYHGESTVSRKSYPTREEIEEQRERLAQLQGMSEEEFEEHLMEIGGEDFVRRYREAS